MKEVGYLFSVITVMVFGCAYSGYALSVLWAWFLVPVFGLPFLSIPVAIGISIIVSYLVKDYSDEDDDRTAEQKLFRAVCVAIIKPSVTLFVGWVVTFFL